MPTFAQAMQEADATGVPVVEGSAAPRGDDREMKERPGGSGYVDEAPAPRRRSARRRDFSRVPQVSITHQRRSRFLLRST